MNLKELIANAETLDITTIRNLWKDTESLSDEKIKERTIYGLHLLKSLTKYDKEQKTIRPDKQGVVFSIKHCKGKKKDCKSFWFSLYEGDPTNIVVSFTDRDPLTGNAIATDMDGIEIVSGKGWKTIRKYFETGKPTKEVVPEKAETPVKDEIPETEIEAEPEDISMEPISIKDITDETDGDITEIPF